MFWKCIEDLIRLDHGPRPAHTENSVGCGGQGQGGGEEEEIIEKWEYVQQCDCSVLNYQCVFTKRVIL